MHYVLPGLDLIGVLKCCLASKLYSCHIRRACWHCLQGERQARSKWRATEVAAADNARQRTAEPAEAQEPAQAASEALSNGSLEKALTKDAQAVLALLASAHARAAEVVAVLGHSQDFAAFVQAAAAASPARLPQMAVGVTFKIAPLRRAWIVNHRVEKLPWMEVEGSALSSTASVDMAQHVAKHARPPSCRDHSPSGPGLCLGFSGLKVNWHVLRATGGPAACSALGCAGGRIEQGSCCAAGRA